MATSVGLSGIAPKAGDSWKPEPGDIVEGEVLYVGTTISDSYDRKKKELELRIDLVQPTGQKITVWATMETDIDPATGQPTANSYPKRDARAIAAAVQATGTGDIEVGGYLKMQRVADEPTDFGEAKTFVAQYTRPKPKPAGVQLPPANTPAPAPRPATPAPGAFQTPPAAPVHALPDHVPPFQPIPAQFQPAATPAPAVADGATLDWLAATTGTPRTVLDMMTPEQITQLIASVQPPAAPAPAPQGNPLGSLMAPRAQ